MLALYFVVCGFTFGLYRLDKIITVPTPLGDLNGNDVMLALLLLFSIPEYLRRRKEHPSPWFVRVEIAWVILVSMLAVAAFNSVAVTLRDRFVNMRFLEPYLLFFPTVAVLKNYRRLYLCMAFGICIAVLGTALTIAQSLHGLSLLFDSSLYNIGSWGGNRGIAGGLVRVNLPISNWVAFVILVLLAALLVRWRWWVAGLVGVLSVTIFVNLARSLWLSLLIAFVLEVALFLWEGILDLRSAVRIGLLPVVIAVALLLAPLIGLGSLGESMAGRVAEGVQNFSSGSGTWADRMDQNAWTWRILDEGHWLFGLGTDYQSAAGYMTDMGLPATLLSVGLFGLVIFFAVLIVCIFGGLAGMKEGVRRDDLFAVLLGVALPAVIIQRLVFQHWLYPESAGILAVAAGAALMVPYLRAELSDGSAREDHEFEKSKPEQAVPQ